MCARGAIVSGMIATLAASALWAVPAAAAPTPAAPADRAVVEPAPNTFAAYGDGRSDRLTFKLSTRFPQDGVVHRPFVADRSVAVQAAAGFAGQVEVDLSDRDLAGATVYWQVSERVCDDFEFGMCWDSHVEYGPLLTVTVRDAVAPEMGSTSLAGAGVSDFRGRATVKTSCDERCTVTAVAEVYVPRGGGRLRRVPGRLGPRTVRLDAGERGRIVLRASRAMRRRVQRAMRWHDGRLIATVVAADDAGNKAEPVRRRLRIYPRELPQRSCGPVSSPNADHIRSTIACPSAQRLVRITMFRQACMAGDATCYVRFEGHRWFCFTEAVDRFGFHHTGTCFTGAHDVDFKFFVGIGPGDNDA
jgi:hypothetical protein